MIKSGKFDHDKFHAELCLIGLTPELFVKKYDLFKTMDRRKIINAIYQERPSWLFDWCWVDSIENKSWMADFTGEIVNVNRRLTNFKVKLVESRLTKM